MTVDGRDVTDTPIELRSGQKLANVHVVFTDKQTEINGTLTDEHGTPVPIHRARLSDRPVAVAAAVARRS